MILVLCLTKRCQEAISNGDHSRLERDTMKKLSPSGERCISMKPIIDVEASTNYPAEDCRSGDDCFDRFRRSPGVKATKADKQCLLSDRPSQKFMIRRSRKQRRARRTKRSHILSF